MSAGSWTVDKKYLCEGVKAGVYPEFMVVSIGVEKRAGDGSECTYLSAAEQKHRLCVRSELSFTMVNNFVRCVIQPIRSTMGACAAENW